MNSFFVLLKKEFTELWRSKKILILCIVFLFVAISSPIIAKLIPNLIKSLPPQEGITIKVPEPTYKDAIDQFVKNLSQIGIFVLIFVFAGSVAEEKSRKTLELLLVKPISRFSFILAKFKTSFIAVFLSMLASSIIFYFYTVSLFGHFDSIKFAELSISIFAYICLIISATIFASVIVNNTIIAAGLGLVGFILFSSIASIIKKIADYAPNYIIGNYKDLISNGWSTDLTRPLIVNLVLIVIFITLSLLIFRRQEIER